MTRDPEIQRLLDRQAIDDCLARYARGLDRHDTELLLSAFHEDAVDRHGDFLGSREELAAWGNAGHARDTVAHTHFLGSRTVEFDGQDTAHVETYVLFVHRRRGEPVVDLGGGRYADRFERRGGEWRIAERLLVMDWMGEADGSDSKRILERSVPGTWDRSDPSYARPLDVASLRPQGEREGDGR